MLEPKFPPTPKAEINDYIALKRKLFNEVKLKLEKRETLKSLDELQEEKYIDINNNFHHFRRVSISDFIIFNTLFHRRISTGIKKGKEKELNKFWMIIDDGEISAEISEILSGIKKLIPKAKNIGIIKKLLANIKKNYDTDQIVEILKKTVRLVRNIKEKFQKEKDPHSRSKCNSGDFCWSFVAQAFPGPVVNP